MKPEAYASPIGLSILHDIESNKCQRSKQVVAHSPMRLGNVPGDYLTGVLVRVGDC